MFASKHHQLGACCGKEAGSWLLNIFLLSGMLLSETRLDLPAASLVELVNPPGVIVQGAGRNDRILESVQRYKRFNLQFIGIRIINIIKFINRVIWLYLQQRAIPLKGLSQIPNRKLRMALHLI